MLNLRLPVRRASHLTLLMTATAGIAIATPPALEFQFEALTVGAGRLEAEGSRIPGGNSQGITGSLLARQPLGAKGWYWNYGLQIENFSFQGDGSAPRRLRDYAAIFSIEYYEGTEPAAALILRPGCYFANRVTTKAWDVPVELTSGLPITKNFNGVIGFSNSRFYHHPLPIVGVIWTATGRIRIEALYPEPAVVLTLGRASSLRFGGELTGGGFALDSPARHTVVEYLSYRVGAMWTVESRPGVKLGIGAGVEIERSFDFFREPRRMHGAGTGYLKIGASFLR